MPRGKPLEEQGDTSQNLTLGRRIPHPASTKYDDGGPPAKRLCTPSTTNEEESSRSDSGDEPVSHFPPEVPDSGDGQESDDDGPRRTGLESALAPMRTDKDAIEDYESMRRDDRDLPEELRARLNQRSWTRGQTSIYVDAFNLALQIVLADEGHLFDEKERQVFKIWEELQYEAQFLRYVRLFLRKTSAWHRINRLAYCNDVKDIPATSNVLQSIHQLPKSTAECQINPAELTPPEDTVLGSSFCFAEHSENIGLEEASSLLNLDELKGITKGAKIQGKNKSELLAALRRMSHYQSGLGWTRLKRTESTDSIDSSSEEKNINSKDGNVSSDTTMEKYLLHKIHAITGHSIRLSSPILRLFERVHLVFYRSTEWTESSLTTIILARISRRNFAEYIVSRSANIFPSRSQLLEFEAAIRTQFRVDTILEYNGNPGKEGLNQVLSIFDEVYPRWQYLTREEQLKEERVYESGEGAYLRRFSPAWIYTRIIHKGAYVLGRFKMYEREHEVMTGLLDQRLFHSARRGAWYQRKALLEEHYMSALQPPDGISDIQLHKRHWKRRSLLTCEQGLQDKDCHTIYHHDLQKRIKKLEKSLKIPKREQHDFGHVLLGKPVEVYAEGIQIKKVYSVVRRNSSTKSLVKEIGNEPTSLSANNSKSQIPPRGGLIAEDRPRSTKTIWVDELEGGGECSVEEMCLSWYRSQGWKGYHAEGGIIRTLFAYLFYDILFLYIPNVFQTPYQICPLDLHTDAFFPSRASEINHRLVQISNGEAKRLIREISAREAERKTCVVGLNWDFEIEDLLEIVECFNGPALAIVCKILAEEYRVREGGIPDLFLWHPAKKEIFFSEVKSENDRLSDTQRLWIHVLIAAGIRVELCNAVAKEVRTVIVD